MGLDEQLMVEQGTGQGTGPIRTLVEIAAIGAVVGLASHAIMFTLPEFRDLYRNVGVEGKVFLSGAHLLTSALLTLAMVYGGCGLMELTTRYLSRHYRRQ